jgi:hypothetical protein
MLPVLQRIERAPGIRLLLGVPEIHCIFSTLKETTSARRCAQTNFCLKLSCNYPTGLLGSSVAGFCTAEHHKGKSQLVILGQIALNTLFRGAPVLLPIWPKRETSWLPVALGHEWDKLS